MQPTAMMMMEFTFLGWWGWLMLYPLYATTQENDDDHS